MKKPSIPELAKRLRLSEPQRKFAEALAADPRRHQTNAAKAAGSKRPAEAGSRWARDAKVVEYMQALVRLAMEQGAPPPAQDLAQAQRGTIATVKECLEYLTMVQRSRLVDYLGDDGEVSIAKLRTAPPGLLRALKISSTTDAEGQVFARHDIVAESGIAATAKLLEYHRPPAPPPPPAAPTINIYAVLAELPSEALRALLEAAHRHEAIETPAKVVG